MLGWGLRRLERFDDAQQAFLEALNCEGGDKNSDVFNELALCLMEKKDFAQAKKCLENALALESDSTKIMSNLGFLALKQGNKEEAQKYFTSVLEYDPDDKIALAELAELEKK